MCEKAIFKMQKSIVNIALFSFLQLLTCFQGGVEAADGRGESSGRLSVCSLHAASELGVG